jgi:glycerophosphoryl diester phosphodiesterase
MSRLIAIGILGLSLGFGPESRGQTFPFFEPVQPPRAAQVMQHRGASWAPENTAAAIEQAILDGFEWVEIDLRMCKDDHHVLLHDSRLERTTDGSGLVTEKTLDELKRLDAGSKFAKRYAGAQILTLEETLKLARSRINLYLDCKQINPATLVKAILDAGMEKQVIVFDSLESLERVKKAAGGDKIALMPKWRADREERIVALGVAAVEINAADVTLDRCKYFHNQGIKVQAKVLDQEDRAEVWDRMILAGVDWLQTDLAEEIIARQAIKKIATRSVKIAHHRGANRYAPENTLIAYEKSRKLGADFVEFDVRTTRDGGLFLLHDGMLNRTTNGRGGIREATSAQIQTLDAGSWFGMRFRSTTVPSLAQFLDAHGRHVELYFDAKDIAPESLAEALRSRGLIERTVVYGGVEFLEKLRKIEPKLRRMPGLSNASKMDEIIKRVDPYAFDTRWSLLSKELIDRCHARGVKVYSDALGFNESIPSYQKAIREGIDLIQTDHPLRVLRALELMNESGR